MIINVMFQYQEVHIFGDNESLRSLLKHKECLPWHECITFRGELCSASTGTGPVTNPTTLGLVAKVVGS